MTAAEELKAVSRQVLVALKELDRDNGGNLLDDEACAFVLRVAAYAIISRSHELDALAQQLGRQLAAEELLS